MFLFATSKVATQKPFCCTKMLFLFATTQFQFFRLPILHHSLMTTNKAQEISDLHRTRFPTNWVSYFTVNAVIPGNVIDWVTCNNHIITTL